MECNLRARTSPQTRPPEPGSQNASCDGAAHCDSRQLGTSDVDVGADDASEETDVRSARRAAGAPAAAPDSAAGSSAAQAAPSHS